MIAGLRLLMFSQGDGTLIRVLLETLQVLPILIASTLQVLPWALAVLASILIFNASSRALVWTWMSRNGPVAYVAVMAAVLTLFVTPLLVLLIIVVLYLLLGLVVVASQKEAKGAKALTKFLRKGDNEDPRSAFVGLLLFPLLLSQFTNFSTFWLPREIVTVDERAVNGYVLETSAEWTTVLTPDRAILRYRTAEVTDRIVCDQGETRTLLNFVSERKGDPESCEPGKPIAPTITE